MSLDAKRVSLYLERCPPVNNQEGCMLSKCEWWMFRVWMMLEGPAKWEVKQKCPNWTIDRHHPEKVFLKARDTSAFLRCGFAVLSVSHHAKLIVVRVERGERFLLPDE